MQLSATLADKQKKLAAIISREGRAAVACSGGVDSSLLLKITHDVLGNDNTIAVFAETPLLPPDEIEAAREIIYRVGSRLLTVKINPLNWPEFTRNPRERCYICKKKIYQIFLEVIGTHGFTVLMDGTNLDDLADFRPGRKALQELAIRTPLAEASLTKEDVRHLSRELALPTWDRHSSSCLATRVATGQFISEEKLEQIRRCEAVLHGLGFLGCRVRITNDTAVIELQEQDITNFTAKEIRQTVLKEFNNYKLKKIFLDLSGRKGICF